MKAKTYFISTLALTILLAVGFMAFNYWTDIYGVFDQNKNEIKIYANERSSKFLLAHKYIPQNFDSFIIGPSLAANLNPADVPEQNLYNAACLGLNATEMKVLSQKILEAKTTKKIFVCVDPYILASSGMKTNMMHAKEVQGALGSTGLVKTYFLKMIRENELLPHKFPKDIIDANGYNNYNLEMKHKDAIGMIQEKVQTIKDYSITVDPVAVADLDTLLNTIRKSDIELVIYFSPVPSELYALRQKEYKKFYDAIESVLKLEDTFLDFNTAEYQNFTSDYSNYIDHGHLSDKGAAFVLKTLVKFPNHENMVSK